MKIVPSIYEIHQLPIKSAFSYGFSPWVSCLFLAVIPPGGARGCQPQSLGGGTVLSDAWTGELLYVLWEIMYIHIYTLGIQTYDQLVFL